MVMYETPIFGVDRGHRVEAAILAPGSSLSDKESLRTDNRLIQKKVLSLKEADIEGRH